jgi:hypothetical protein
MTDKRFLVPVLTLLAFGLPVGANVVPYCDYEGNCGANTTSAFSSAVALDGYSYASGTDLIFSGSLSDGNLEYNDGLTSVLFDSTSAFTITGSTLVATVDKPITITVPAAYAAIQLFLSNAGGGFDWTCLGGTSDCTYLSPTPIEVDYLNNTPGSAWTITITPEVSSEQIVVNSFNPAGAASQGPSDTPEVGTLLLIGSGLIAMRWIRRARPRSFRTPQPA